MSFSMYLMSICGHIEGVFSFLSPLLSFYPHFITPSLPLLFLRRDDDLCKGLDGNSHRSDVALFLYYEQLRPSPPGTQPQYPPPVPPKTLPWIVSFYPACLYVSLQVGNLERATEKFSSVSAWDIDMGRVTNGQMHRQQSRPSIKQFLVS